VLAGGRSTRFGSDKLAAPYEGRPLVDHAVGRMAELCDEVVLVLAPGAPEPGPSERVRVVHDATEGEGPLAGLHAGLLAAVRSDVAVVVGGDMPDVRQPVVAAMLRTLEDTGLDAVALEVDGARRAIPIAVRTWPSAEAVHALLHAGRRRLGDVLDVLGTAVIEEATWTALDPERRSVFDVDEPGDLNR
jgi:molybdopterin-guanine dinucleotide biosynthesis protein A